MEPELEATSDLDRVLSGVDVVVALNSEPSYRDIEWLKVATTNSSMFVIDTRSILDEQAIAMSDLEFTVLGSTS